MSIDNVIIDLLPFVISTTLLISESVYFVRSTYILIEFLYKHTKTDFNLHKLKNINTFQVVKKKILMAFKKLPQVTFFLTY